MGLLYEFTRLLTSAETGKPDALELKIGEKIYHRNFRPQERLLVLGGGHV